MEYNVGEQTYIQLKKKKEIGYSNYSIYAQIRQKNKEKIKIKNSPVGGSEEQTIKHNYVLSLTPLCCCLIIWHYLNKVKTLS